MMWHGNSASACDRATAGFSLVEMLATIAILVMVTAVVSTGIPSALAAYEKVVDSASAQTVLATASTRLRSILDSATAVTVAADDSNEVVEFVDGDTGYITKLSSDGSTIVVSDQRPNNDEGDNHSRVEDGRRWHDEPLLLSQEAQGHSVSFEEVTYDESKGVFTITGLVVKDAQTGNALTDTGGSLVVKTITAPEATSVTDEARS